MAKVEFVYDGETIEILCEENETMEKICKKLTVKLNKDINDFSFLYGGNQIDLKLTFFQIAKNEDRERKVISILVYQLAPKTIVKGSKIIKSSFPICPSCQENLKFEIDDYKIICSECKNGHSFDMYINEYQDFQNIDISKITCDNCSRSKYNTYKNEMYICNSCNIKLCYSCKSDHDKNHCIVN